MDFIEQIFGVSPDNGDGSTELMLVLAVLVVIAVVFRRPISRMLSGRKPKP